MSSSEANTRLQKLFFRFQPMLVAYARQYLRSEEDAREAVQDVFLGVWNNRGHLELDESLKPYLFTATRNKALNYLKKRRPDAIPIEEAPDQASGLPGVVEQLQAEEMKAIIYDEVRQLPDRCREAFILSRQEGLSHREVAERLGISEKTVENQIGIALKRLRSRIFSPNEGEGSGGYLPAILLLLVYLEKTGALLWGEAF